LFEDSQKRLVVTTELGIECARKPDDEPHTVAESIVA
jgi:hypothetical protein